jgi:hypothetical protein
LGMGKTDKKQEQWLKWIWDADQQRKNLEAMKIGVKEGRKVSREEKKQLGYDLFTREVTPDPHYNPKNFAALLNAQPDATKKAMRTWNRMTADIRKWQDVVIGMNSQESKRTEAAILIGMFNAMVSGHLVKIRTCVQCGKVFSAYKSNNQFHSAACRKQFYHEVETKQPGYREGHAAKAKTRYHAEKERLEKDLKLARWKK